MEIEVYDGLWQLSVPLQDGAPAIRATGGSSFWQLGWWNFLAYQDFLPFYFLPTAFRTITERWQRFHSGD
jgi:hypothetical protein